MSTLEMLTLVVALAGLSMFLVFLVRPQPLVEDREPKQEPRFPRDVFGRSTRNQQQRMIRRHYRYHPARFSKRAHGGRMISRNTRKARCQTLRCRAKAQLDWFKPSFTNINRRWSKPRWDERPVTQYGL